MFNVDFLFSSPQNIFYAASSLIASLCVLAVFIAVLIDFVEFQKRDRVKKTKKSLVETGTMFLFFFFFYSLIRFGIGRFDWPLSPLKICLIAVGVVVMIFSAAVNILGRVKLGKNWANQIKIYQDHFLVSTGVYRLVRHPLYASIIWMFFGACLVYSNYAAALANSLIFIPFMYHRAKQEEDLLSKEFKDYNNYQKNVGMFFPKIF